MKNKIIITIVVLLCFIPTLAAVLSYNQVQNAPIDVNTAVSITLKDINQKEFVLTREKDGEEAEALIEFFLSMKKKSQPIPALPTSLTGEKCYVVTVSSNVKNESYECYFSQDPATNYFVSSNGTYKINEDDAKQFITSVYAESLYDDSSIPTLLLAHEYYVTPDNAVWQYKNYTGEYVERDVNELVNPAFETFELEGGLDLTFSNLPDYCTVKVVDAKNGSVLYDDMLANLSLFRLDNTKEVKVDVTAKWYDDPGRSFCGELNFSFGSLVSAPAEFYLGLTTVESGKFTAITALNITRPEKIEFVSTLPGGVTPKFYDAGDNRAVALLPISADCQTGIYTLTFSYGGVTQNTNLTIENPGPKYSYYTVPASVVSVYRTTAALEQFENAVQEIMAKSSSTRHFSGHFVLGVTGNYQLMRGFGRDVYLNNNTTVTYRNNGVDYTAVAGSDIVACNAGEVVYVGILDYAGNIVVIDHGWGLKTWYYNLGSVTATVGDTVVRGEKIGTAGQTGFTGAVGAHIAMSVGNQFVSPYDTWSDSPIAGKVVIAKIDERT